MRDDTLYTYHCTQARLQQEMRALVPWYCPVYVHTPQQPECHAWQGGSRFANGDEFTAFAVSRTDYAEHGHRLCSEKFADW
jgi:actin-related protein